MTPAKIHMLSEHQAREYIEGLRWPEGTVCPKCGAKNCRRMHGKSTPDGTWKCYSCRKKFTVRVGTIFERSHIPLKIWILAFAKICASKKGISALQLQRELGLGSYKTAWHMAHRIRHAMSNDPLKKMLSGEVEVDETYIGGKEGNKHASKRKFPGGGGGGKTPIVAMVQRRSNRIRPIAMLNGTKGGRLKRAIRDNVNEMALISTDELSGYRGIGAHYVGGHHVVNHKSGQYVNGPACTNGAESFFALFKRGVYGVFHHISRKHLQRYLDEFGFRWQTKALTDMERLEAALKLAPGCRLVYSGESEGLASPTSHCPHYR